jgi:hypothetical protein
MHPKMEELMSKKLDQLSKNVDQLSKERTVSVQSEAPALMWRGFPPQRHENRKSWFARVARSLGWGNRRTKAIFYCEARTITADEWRTLNHRLDALKAAEKRQEEAINELRAVLRDQGAVAPVAGGASVVLRGPATGWGRSGHRPGNET